MGAFLDKPKTEKTNQCGNGNGLRYGLSSMQGWRVEMEDAHCAVTQLPARLKNWSFFAVFDGHAGAKVSFYCAEQLLDHILKNEDFRSSIEDAQPSLEKIKNGIRTGFLDLDSKMRNMPEMASGEDKSGSTAVGLLVSPEQLFFANCGDSRSILVRDGKVFHSTKDHKPSNPAEKERIQNAGGSVMIQRVNGSLAVSRALGDFEYKCVVDKGQCEQMVSPEPEITTLERHPTEELCVLACDGIWDVLSNEELCDFIRSRMQLTDKLEDICNEVVDTCLYKGSKDNMSIVIVAFEGAPKICPEAIKREEDLNQRIENKVKEIMEKYPINLVALMHEFAQAGIEGLPPGGGLHAKHSTIEEFYHKYRPITDKDNESNEQDTPFPSFWDGP